MSILNEIGYKYLKARMRINCECLNIYLSMIHIKTNLLTVLAISEKTKLS